ncbi:rhamnulokinase [Oerskovia flava]|uniref:rhamnulokinase n=1 Tax=Oerskovia flava TaxID=2986422 RepID=UPI002240AF43|nr:rhamnulokinase family protein [Oerskovia sp. JB1-3-2]
MSVERADELDVPRGSAAFVAVDLGATSGRVILGVVENPAPGTDLPDGGGAPRVHLVETARFTNGPVALPVSAPAGEPGPGDTGTALHWDVLHLWRGVLDGVRAAGLLARRHGLEVRGVGVDSWAVDYGLLDATGALLGNPRHYRDPRTTGVPDAVYARVDAATHYAVNGLQTLPFNTEFQLVAGADDATWAAAAELLLVPDLMTYWLTGRRVAEVTNASTTGLLDTRSRTWSDDLVARLGAEYPALGALRDRLPALVEPGTVVGHLLPAVQEATGLGAVPVVAVASHDTASAVVAVPASTPGATVAYVSCGTWSLVGLELDEPVLSEASRAANFTNELGLDGSVRYLRNVMGLWVLNECVREWTEAGDDVDLGALLAAAGDEPGGGCLVDVDGDEFLAPGSMPDRVRAAARRTGQEVPQTRPALVRAVLDSLAAAYARALTQACELSGARVDTLYLVGGGSQNELLCRLTAEATGLPVVAGPVEAAALGNVLVQARAGGAVSGGLPDLRRVVVASSTLRRVEPRAAGTLVG